MHAKKPSQDQRAARLALNKMGGMMMGTLFKV
jgi:hypothetical protein